MLVLTDVFFREYPLQNGLFTFCLLLTSKQDVGKYDVIFTLLWEIILKSSDPLIMGKVKIGIYCYLSADILTHIFRKYLLSDPPPNLYFVSKPVNLISCHGNQKAKFLKKKKRINSFLSHLL